MFGNVTIIGLGLMGGSLAKVLRKKKLAKKISALAKNEKSRKRYQRLGLVDQVTCDLAEAVRDAQVVVLCVSPTLIQDYMRRLRFLADTDVLIMDIGSTKERIMRAAGRIFYKRANFVGAHPMAGSEKTGAEHATDDLYLDNLCFLTPLRKNEFYKKADAFWRKIGCSVKTVSPKVHDSIVAYVSHLPHILSFSLLAMVPKPFRVFGASGYRSVTRLGYSDPVMWADIIRSNKRQIRTVIAAYIQQLKKIDRGLDTKDARALIGALQPRRK